MSLATMITLTAGVVWIVTLITGKLILPAELAYKIRYSLIVTLIGIVLFFIEALYLFTEAPNNFSFLLPTLFMLVGLVYLFMGGTNVPFMTITGVFSKKTNRPVGRLKEGQTGWRDPISEEIRSNPDSLDTAEELQAISGTIHETPWYQTSQRGIEARLLELKFYLRFREDELYDALQIRGGSDTIRDNTSLELLSILWEEMGNHSPQTIDQKAQFKHDLATVLVEKLQHHLDETKTPYDVVNLTIGDSELPPKYYDALGKKHFTELEQDAEDEKARRITKRIKERGAELLPDGSHSQQNENALIALGIIKKDIHEEQQNNSYNVDLGENAVNALANALDSLKKK